jgi:hypothetical protein
VSAIESSNHCNVSSWSGNQVFVRCYNALGEPSDTRYLVKVVQEAESDVTVLGYAMSINDVDEDSDLTGERLHQVIATGADFSTTHPQVSERFFKHQCVIAQWASEWVKVNCYDAAAAPKDTLSSLGVVE